MNAPVRITLLRSAFALWLALAVTLAQAQVPRTVNYQGFLSNSANVPVNATVQLTFRLYDALTGGNQLWTEGPNNVAVVNGVFNVVLGSVTPFPPTLAFDKPYFLSVQVVPDPEMTPRQALTASPYSLRAAIADAVNSSTPLRIGSDNAAPCDAQRAGSLRWNAAAVALEVCDGAVWRPIAVGAAPSTYTIGGTISDLGGTVVLRNNGGNDLSVSANGSFTFSVALADGSPYNVTVLTQPAGQTCLVSGGSGTVSGANVTSVSVTCSNNSVGVSAQIAAARAAPDGASSLAIAGAIVTYVKPAIGADPAGFFVQGEMAGPALFIAVDAATLAPVPVAGDTVSFTVTAMGTVSLRRQATAITGFTRESQGSSLAALVQSVSGSSDLVSNVTGYESELVSANVTISGAFFASGTGFVSAPAATSGLPSDPNLFLRMPSALLAESGLTSGCTLTVQATPLWRLGNLAEFAPMVMADLTNIACPAPVLSSATATSATGVSLSFNRAIASASITDAATQFVIPGLTVASAVASGASVALGTSAQTPGAAYDVTVANSVQDIFGVGVSASANSAAFLGFQQPAQMVINEVNANVTGGCDLVELRVIASGSTYNIALWERDAPVFTFPTMNVVTNDIIVIHFNGGSLTCNPATSPNETTGMAQVPTATNSANYDTAYDWYTVDTGLTSTDNVLTIVGAGAIVDAVFLADAPTGTAAAGSEAQAATVAAAGQWEQDGGGVPVGGFIDDAFCANAALDLDATGATVTGQSIQRMNNTDTNRKGDWTQANSSWGMLNVGQTPLP